ncbi:AmmeMemoRadiSam system radical SAM enzyme [Candidatus Aerophobetes bacterium]|nr:AmmeMemoRadiSam system radical SAM enzyme [Candidatus Aerophobetes bacterium]
MKQAKFYQKIDGKKVKCLLCPHECQISPDKRGICGVRENKGGKLFSLVYEKIISWAMDPIEKKPLYHFLPGGDAFSLATFGCNFRCLNCQNYTISQVYKDTEDIPGEIVPAKKVVELAKQKKSKIIAYTYTEPTIFYEYAYDICEIAHAEKIKNVFVTNGYIRPEPLREISPFLDAANVDLKSMRDNFYRKICGGKLQPVLDSIKLMHELGIWVEITTLVIPGINDTDEELMSIASFILQIDSDIPWHISRFYPAHKMQNYPPTPLDTLYRAKQIGQKVGLKFVYLGNVPGNESENTFCPNCGRTVIKRAGYHISSINLKNGSCIWCDNKIAGVWG